MTRRTTIYLDVDGVLNAIPASKDKVALTGWDNWESAWINGYLITWSTDLVQALNDLADREDVEIRWLTTWRELAVEHIAPGLSLNGTGWSVVTDGTPGAGYQHTGSIPGWGQFGWWKMNAMAEDIDLVKPEKIVWIDDDLFHSVPDAQSLFKAKGLAESDYRLVFPDTRLGLTRPAVSAILDFITEG